MGSAEEKRRAGDVGRGVAVLIALLALLYMFGERQGWWKERGILLVTVREARELLTGAPVFYQGVEIGKVVRMEPPSPEMPGYKLRLEVDAKAFKHIPLDAPVRIDQARGNKLLRQVTILPGREMPDWNFPGRVKVLREVTPEEEVLRMFRDVLDGLLQLSKAKTSEAELMDLREEVSKLRAQLKYSACPCPQKTDNAAGGGKPLAPKRKRQK